MQELAAHSETENDGSNMSVIESGARGLIGNVEGIDGLYLHGWVFWDGQPDQKVVVNVIIDDVLVGEAIADRPRGDLIEAGRTPPNCSFLFRIDDKFFDNRKHEIKVIEPDTNTVLFPGAKLTFFPGADAESSIFKITSNPLFRNRIYQLFDGRYYQAQAGVSESEEPLKHYQRIGWRQGFNPHPLFDTVYYLEANKIEMDVDPLTHFFAIGHEQNLEVHPLFDSRAYAERRPDVPLEGLHPILHYLVDGWKEREIVSEFFDDSHYEEQCPGLIELGFAPIVHYLTIGWLEGRRPHREFDPGLFAKCAALSSEVEPYTYFVKKSLLKEIPKQNLRHGHAPVSIVMLNLEKSLTTLQCLYFLRLLTNSEDYDVIVVDNGSSAKNFSLLCRFAVDVQIIRLPSNKGFGEGNNIGVEHALGDFILFMNNDVFVTANWLNPLLSCLMEHKDVGAVGPMFLYPSGSLQEAGAMISFDGTALQRGKHLDPEDEMFLSKNEVDYCSAATLLMRKDDFKSVLGFDLCWDPAYYEDSDLCLKLRLIGKSIVYVPDSKVYHIENATSSDSKLDLRLNNVVETNRLKFVSRWSHYLRNGSTDNVSHLTREFPVRRPRSSDRKLLGLYTPYPLYPGGGERYLLSIAAATKSSYDVVLLTPELVSTFRVLTLARELQIDVDHLHTDTWQRAASYEKFDVLIVMGNEIIPPVPAIAKKNIFHCQFPFPLSEHQLLRDWGNYQNYDEVIVNSKFTRHHVLSAATEFHLNLPPVTVISPPVPQVMFDREERTSRRDVILSVGRFAPGGHCKRQDIMIEQFKKLLKEFSGSVELHLAGALGTSSGDREYLLSLQKAARGFPIRFHVNVSAAQVHALYQTASVYWHCTGINDDVQKHPERFEHFGITIVEAMSAGIIPVVLRYGGPSEIIEEGLSGFLVNDALGLRKCTLELLKMHETDRTSLRISAAERAADFGFEAFALKIENALA